MHIPAAIFKANCLKLMDEVARTGEPVVVTKHGKPVAQLVSIPTEPKSLFGYMKNTLKIKGNIVAATDDEWSAVSGRDNALFGTSAKSRRFRRGPKKK